jgi:HK97 family phage major capsid protein
MSCQAEGRPEQLSLADGRYQVWQPSTILELPGCPLRGHADDCGFSSLSVAFGDFREAYTIVDRLGITLLRDQYTAKPFVKFYTRRRVGGAS